MINNQEILRKHTALTISRKDVDTSFILFPVRLETRFVQRHPVEDISEPDRALYAFKAIWEYLVFLGEEDAQDALPECAIRVMEAVESLDTVYREDKRRLGNLIRSIVSAVNPQGEERKAWDRALVHMDRLTTMDFVVDNEATEYLRRLDAVCRTLDQLRSNPRYSGMARSEGERPYSTTAKFRYARKKMQECLPVLEQLLPADPSKSIVNRFAFVTEKQLKKFQRAIRVFYPTAADIKAVYSDTDVPGQYGKRGLAQRKMMKEALYRDLDTFGVYRDRFKGKIDSRGNVLVRSRQQSLTDKMRSKIGEYNHYTRFAEQMMMWRLRMVTGKKRDISTDKRVEKWRTMADNTIFSFHEEREWLLSVLEVYNEYKQNHELSQKISGSRLNRHNRYIRPRKLKYLKEKKCLLVRIYPDEVAVTQLSRPLSTDEVNHARTFWARYFAANGDEQKKKAAWKGLCSLYPAPRAALIARHVFPDSQANLARLKKVALQHARDILAGKMTGDHESFGGCFIAVNGDPGSPDELFPVPMSELLPDRFVLQATMVNGGKDPLTLVRYGRLIPQSVQIGWDFNSDPTVDDSQGRIRLDGNLRWMTDYDAAERMGLAITVPLDAYHLDHHTKHQKAQAKKLNKPLTPKERVFEFSSIYVMGLKEFDRDNRKDSDECSRFLAEVFNAHLYSEDGLDLLRIGSPTNILSDEDMAAAGTGGAAKSSEYDTGTDAQVDEFFHKSIEPLTQEPRKASGSDDASRLSDLFGFGSLPARDNPFLNVKNWDNWELENARLVRGAFLNVLRPMHPILDLIASNKRLSNYFVNDVSPVGVYPPFRVGSQPYGIVPVCDFKDLRYNLKDPLDTLREILLLLTGKWNAIAASTVISEANMARGTKLSTEEAYVKAVSATPISSSFYKRTCIREKDMLASPFFRGIKDGEKPFENLFNIVHRWSESMTEKDFIDKFFPRFYDLPIRDPEFTRQIGDKDGKAFSWGKLKNEIRKQAMIRSLSNKEYEDLITATFDLFNYRLDAWLTGLLEHRIRLRIQKRKTHKIAVGAYGWVFNLKEDPAEHISDEYVVAPSLNQAITAAVLRSGFVRANEGYTKDYSLSVNLSSERVRQALRIIRGVKNGLSLGTILGSDLERMLHDDKKNGGQDMDYFIYFLRCTYPLNSTSTVLKAGPGGAKDYSLDVLNGVALLEDLWFRAEAQVANARKKHLSDWYGYDSALFWEWLGTLFRTNNKTWIKGQFHNLDEFKAKTTRLVALIQKLDDAYDALSDVILSESVYKLTEGNRVAVDALMNSMNNGRNFPDPDVTEIPVESAHIEQCVFAALDTGLEVTSSPSKFEVAEPALDQWMGEMLGFSRICFPYVYQGKEVLYPLGKNGFGLTPSELVYLSGDWNKFLHFLELCAIQQGRPVPVKDEDDPILLDEARMAVDAMRELISRCRPLRQDDFMTEAVSADPPQELQDQLKKRYAEVRTYMNGQMKQNISMATSFRSMFSDRPYEPLNKHNLELTIKQLQKCFRMGLTDALSDIDYTLSVEEEQRYEHPTEFAEILSRHHQLPDRLDTVSRILEERLAKAEKAAAHSIPEAMKALLGSYFVTVTPFSLQGNEAIRVKELAEQNSEPKYFFNARRSVVEDNLVSLADVRPALSALHQVRLYGKFNFLPAARDVRPLQLAAKSEYAFAENYWMGAEVGDECYVRDANVYTVLNPDCFVRQGTESQDVAGVVFDYWVERIPYSQQTAAVAFAYDQPDAEPPQAVLVGVSSVGGKHRWSERRMLRTIRSAMYQVQSRAVEPEHIYADKWTSAVFPVVNLDPENPLEGPISDK